jgi:hypothetical protein
MEPFFATLGIILGLSGTPSFAAEPPPPTPNDQVSLETCFTTAELQAAEQLVAKNEIKIYLKAHDYAVAAHMYRKSFDCELMSDLYEYSINKIDWDALINDNQTVAAMYEIVEVADTAGIERKRLWVLLSVLYEKQLGSQASLP